MFQNEDWDIDEDYFKDFNADEIVKEIEEENKKGPLTSTIEQYSQLQQKARIDNLQFQSNSDEELKGPMCTSTISHRNVILDIFKNNDNVQKDSDSSRNLNKNSSIQKLHHISEESSITKFNETTNKNLILNILQNNITLNVNTTDNSSKTKPIVKSALRLPGTHLDNENKFKRKKCVAFNEENVNEAIVAKKMCIFDENYSASKEYNDFNKSKNLIKAKKQILIDTLKLPTQKSTKISLLKNTVTRKFPGPAGLLVDDSDEIEVVNIDVVDKNENKSKKYSDICSQNTKNLFTTGAWQLMMDDLPADFELQDIATIKENALEYSKKYKKVPYLAGIIQYIDYKPNDPHIILKDFSGKIDARVHHSICKLYPNALGTNTAMLLKDVGVIVTSKKYVCIIISPKNLLSIYSDDIRLVQTPELEIILNSNSNCDLPESQISSCNHEDDTKGNKTCEMVHNLSQENKLILKSNSNMNSSTSFVNKECKEKSLLEDCSTSNINGSITHLNREKYSKITDYTDNIEDFDFEDESWFEGNIDDLNSFTVCQFPSSTPIITNNDNSQSNTTENTISEKLK